MKATRYLIHFYDLPEHLFRTVTMVGAEERDAILDALAATQGWYWGRFSASERAGYMARREATESMLYDEFASRHHRLPSQSPVYFYLLPGESRREVEQAARDRWMRGNGTQLLLLDLTKIEDTSSLTFTVGDSMRSYARRLQACGVPIRAAARPAIALPDHGRVFPLGDLAEVYCRNADVPDLVFEVQVWDRHVLLNYVREHVPALERWLGARRG